MSLFDSIRDIFDFEELNRKFIRMQFTSKARTRLYRKLISYLRNGVSLAQALDFMWEHETDDGKRHKSAIGIIINDWRRLVRDGKSFGRAIADWVPDNDRVIIEAGEVAGRLDIAIENALFIAEGSKKIRNAIVGGLAYPALLVLVAIGFMVMFGIKIVPAFEEIMPRERWYGAAAHMALVSDFVRYWMLPIGIAMVAMGFVIFATMGRWTGSLRVKFDRVPPWSLYRLNAGAGFMLSVSALVRAGVQIPEILRILKRGANAWYYERIDGALRNMESGANLGLALFETGHGFPDIETVRDLRSFATLQGFDETLEKMGRQWIEDSVERIQAQMAVLRNASFIIMGLVFALIANGIFALEQQVTTGL